MCAVRTPDLDGTAPAATLDAGEQNCAVLIMNVRAAIAALEPGEILEVVAYDPSAQLDLLAWSRMTGHVYLSMAAHDDYNVYYLRKRDKPDGEDSGVRQLRQ